MSAGRFTGIARTQRRNSSPVLTPLCRQWDFRTGIRSCVRCAVRFDISSYRTNQPPPDKSQPAPFKPSLAKGSAIAVVGMIDQRRLLAGQRQDVVLTTMTHKAM